MQQKIARADATHMSENVQRHGGVKFHSDSGLIQL